MRKKYQSGMTGLGWVIVLGLIGFFAMITIRLVPVVMEGFTIKKHIETLNQVPLITRMTKAEIRALIQRRMDVDDIETIKNENIKIERKPGHLFITLEYEIRKPLMGRYEIVAKHKNSIDLISN